MSDAMRGVRRLPAPAAALGLLALAACGDAPATLPPDPPGVTAGEGAVPEAVRSADERARKAVLDQLASRFGRGLRVLARRVDSDAEPGPIKAHYESALIGARGWREFPLGPDDTAWSFAFTSPDGRSVLAVVVLNPRYAPEGGGDVPLTVLTNLKGEGG